MEKETKHTPEKPFGKFPNDPVLGAIAQLAYRCIQWEDGEIKGYDMQMLESLLPIMISPLQTELSEMKKEREETIKELENIREFLTGGYVTRRMNTLLNRIKK